MLSVIDLILALLQTILQSTGHNLPATVVNAIEVAVSEVQKHQNDVVSKENLEALRG